MGNSKNDENNQLQVFSHIRSGTHYLEAFLALNFYPGEKLRKFNVTWGHWSNRKHNWLGNKYGKLFGNHYFIDKNYKRIDNKPSIYIVRDGRAVIYSTWKTPNFLNKDWYPIEFSDFLDRKLDWEGTPSSRANSNLNIIEHWKKHVDEWNEYKHDNLLVIKYEDLVNAPEKVAQSISDKFSLELPKVVRNIDKPVGLKPNEAKINSWEKQFSDKDLEKFFSVVDKNHWALS